MHTNVLVIEDDKGVRDNLVELLEEEGFGVTALSSGKDVVAAVSVATFDVILCDIMMPDKDGYAIFDELTEHMKLNVPPFIFLTAKSDRGDVRRGMEQGADDYITKPYTRSDILNSISVQLKKREKVMQRANIEKDILRIIEDKVPDKSGRLSYGASIFIDKSDNAAFIKISDIIIIKAQKDYSRITIATGQTFTLKKSLNKWEDTLPIDLFIRVHRSTIVNANYISKIDKWFNYSYRITLKNIDEQVIVSQRYSIRLRRHLRE